MTPTGSAPIEIASIRAAAVSVPLTPPVRFATRLVERRDYVLVGMTSRTGDELGIGYTYAGNSGGRLVAEIINDLVAPCLIGRDAFAAEQNWADVYQELLLIGRRGGVIRALSAVDIATWDLIGKTLGRPIRDLLGGAGDSVAAYASGGYYTPGDAVQNVVDEVTRYQAMDFTDFKLKFGGLPLGQDVARVAAARETIGPDCRLALDINNGWQDTTEAMRAIRAVAPFDIWWIEEPFLPDDVRSHVRLSQKSPIPIATGEIEATRWAFAELMEQHAAEIIQPDACVCGGVTEWMRIARAAHALGVPVAPHWHANLHAQLSAATPNCLTVEYFALAEGIYNFEAIVQAPLQVAAGRIILPNEPGIGVTLDFDALRGYGSTFPELWQ